MFRLRVFFIVSAEVMTSINAASTPAFLRAAAVLGVITPVCTKTVKPSSLFTFSMASANSSRGTEPSVRHPPLTRQPTAPFCLSFAHTSNNSEGESAGCMVSRTLPPQCLQFSAQRVPVTEIVGKLDGKEQKNFVL